MIQPTTQNPIPTKSKSYEVILGKGLKVTMDKKSKTRVVSFPFEFPDDTKGVLIMCRIEDEDWIPSNDITSIKIEFK